MDFTKIRKRGDLRKQYPHIQTVREEMRSNLIRMLAAKKPLFADLKGYNDTVIPRVINAILCGHTMIILGERGQGEEPDYPGDWYIFLMNIFQQLTDARYMIIPMHLFVRIAKKTCSFTAMTFR